MGHADITTTMNIYAEATKEKEAGGNGKFERENQDYVTPPNFEVTRGTKPACRNNASE